MKTSYFLVDGLNESSYLYCLPLLSGICKGLEVNRVLIYKTNLLGLESTINGIKKLNCDQFNIEFINYRPIDSLGLLFENPLRFIYLSFQLVKLVVDLFLLRREDLVKTVNSACESYRSGIYHGYSDLLAKRFFSGSPNPYTVRQKLSVINRLMRSILVSWAIERKQCRGIFLGHNVYQTRALSEKALLLGKPIFLHAYFCVSKFFMFSPPPPMPTARTVTVLDSIITDDQVNDYFAKRFAPSSENRDVAMAYSDRGQSFEQACDLEDSVVVFLPIFGDSPFGWRDESRLFADYFDWLVRILDILKRQSRQVIIRMHPSQRAWGEDSAAILREMGLFELPSNFKIDPGSRYKHLDLVVKTAFLFTFKGTVHIERACFGKPSIVATKTLLGEYLPESVFKPRSENEIFKLVADTPTSLSPKCVQRARRLLFYKETCTGYRRLLKSSRVLRCDKKEYAAQQFLALRDHSLANLQFFINEGVRLAVDPLYDQGIFLEDNSCS